MFLIVNHKPFMRLYFKMIYPEILTNSKCGMTWLNDYNTVKLKRCVQIPSLFLVPSQYRLSGEKPQMARRPKGESGIILPSNVRLMTTRRKPPFFKILFIKCNIVLLWAEQILCSNCCWFMSWEKQNRSCPTDHLFIYFWIPGRLQKWGRNLVMKALSPTASLRGISPNHIIIIINSNSRAIILATGPKWMSSFWLLRGTVCDRAKSELSGCKFQFLDEWNFCSALYFTGKLGTH